MPERARILSTESRIVRASSAREPNPPRWRELFRTAIRDLGQLCNFLQIPMLQEVAAAAGAANQFPVLVPRPFLDRIKRGDPNDPLLLQVIANALEMRPSEGFTVDPLREVDPASPVAMPAAGVLQKYAGRALVVSTGACAIHCRYCFRRHFPYAQSALTSARMAELIAAIRRDGSIDEVILSGGDPLSLGDGKLAELIGAIESIEHVQRLRVHTRLPIVIPQRVTKSLVQMLKRSRLASWVVVHCNHANEIDDHVALSLSRLVNAGVPVLNQAVLLRGVNDSVDALAALCLKLINLRVMPYYLHQLDRVVGAAHFEVSEEEGRAIVESLRARLPGYAVPRYVREVAGERSKTPLVPREVQ